MIKEGVQQLLSGFDTESSYLNNSTIQRNGVDGARELIDVTGRKLQIEVYRTKMYNPGGNALEVAGQYYYVGSVSYDGNVTSSSTSFDFTDTKADEAGYYQWVLVDETADGQGSPLSGKHGAESSTGISPSSDISTTLNPFLIFTQNFKRHDPPPKGALLTTFKNCLVVSGNSDNHNIQYSLPFNVLTGEIGSEYFPDDDNGFLVESVSGDRINDIRCKRCALCLSRWIYAYCYR